MRPSMTQNEISARNPELNMHPRQLATGFVLLLSIQTALAENTTEAVAELPEYSRGYDPERNPFDDGRAALALAKSTDRLVMIEVGGDWCYWCLVLDNFMHKHGAVHKKLHENFVLMKVNVSEANENAEFLAGLPHTSGYPHVFISRSDGGLIGSTDLTRLVVKHDYDEQRFLAFLQHWLDLKTASKLTSNP
jgi:thiol:disulfide interchange protein